MKCKNFAEDICLCKNLYRDFESCLGANLLSVILFVRSVHISKPYHLRSHHKLNFDRSCPITQTPFIPTMVVLSKDVIYEAISAIYIKKHLYLLVLVSFVVLIWLTSVNHARFPLHRRQCISLLVSQRTAPIADGSHVYLQCLVRIRCHLDWNTKESFPMFRQKIVRSRKK